MNWLTPAAQDYVRVAEKAGYDFDEISAETAKIAAVDRCQVDTARIERVLDVIRQRKMQEVRGA